MITIDNYVKPATLEEAYKLNQARSSRVMGGMMWMRLGKAHVKTLIDLSGLGLDEIHDEDNVIKIGAMCTLRQVEECEALKELFGDGIAESIRHIVGVQFRNQATIGGSIYGRFGFSDVLTAFLALDTFVELYDGGIVRLSDFVNRAPDKDGFSGDRLRCGDRDRTRAGDMVFLRRRTAYESGADREEMGDPGGRVGRDDRGLCETGGIGIYLRIEHARKRGVQAAPGGSSAAA